jgi:acetyl esterase
MVELHGGALVNGNRLNGDLANEALAKNGVIVVALDFRVPPDASYPASLADINYGIRWAKTRAESWNGGTGRIGAMGTSSGAPHRSTLFRSPTFGKYHFS